MNLANALAALAALSTLVLSPRTEAQVFPPFVASAPGTNYGATSHPPIGQWDVAAAKESLPAGPGGLVDTADCVIAAYIDAGLSAVVRRSIDGGRTWSAPTTLYTLGAGESLDVTTIQVGVTGYTAYVMMATGVIISAGRVSAHDVLVWGSENQGQTWSGPLQMNDGTSTPANPQYDVDAAVMTVSTGVCHVAWEVEYTASTLEDIIYSACLMAGGALIRLNAETRVSNSALITAGTDIDAAIAADGPVVAITWRSPVGGSSATDYDIYVKVSSVTGSDFGAVTQTNLTNFAAVTSAETPTVAVAGPNVYVAWTDNNANLGAALEDDDVKIAVSNNAGGAWNSATVFRAANQWWDADSPQLAAAGNRVVISWMDDRFQPGTVRNISNRVFVKVDNTAGAGLLAGTTPEVQINNMSPPTTLGSSSGATIFEVEMVGDTIGIAFEDCWYNVSANNGEDAVLGFSCDGGQNWNSIFISEIGSPFVPGVGGTEGDIDTPRLAITRGSECVYAFASEPFVFMGPNVLTLTGIGLAPVVETIGIGCVNSTTNVATLAIQNGPAFGHVMTFQIANAPPNQGLSFVMLGFQNLGGLDLGLIGMPGCPLFADPLFSLLASTNGSGIGSANLSVPNDPQQMGTPFFVQPFVTDPGFNAFGAVTGNALRGVIGCL